MPDHATSPDPAVQAQLDRLTALSPGADVLGLSRIAALLDRLGHPERRLPPVFHVAGTNGKGSTCAYLRAAIEAQGLVAHVYTSPHLVRFNERIRVAGTLIDDPALAAVLAEVLDRADGIGASFFEITTAAAFLAFARTPADACIVEVGLGGRLDATNVIATPAVTGIAQLGVDHQAFLGDRIEDIAAEKAGIAKPGAALVTMAYPDPVARRVADCAAAAGARWIADGRDWSWAIAEDGVCYREGDTMVTLSPPALAGAHQAGNLALAVAMLRHQSAVRVDPPALAAAGRMVRWPARLQPLTYGKLRDMLPAGAQLWLDGAHNPAAATALAPGLAGLVAAHGGPLTLVCGLLANKDAAGVLGPLAPHIRNLIAVPVPGHASHPPDSIATIAARDLGLSATVAGDVPMALARVAEGAIVGERPPLVLILGSLYLAGTVLAANGTPPD